MRLRRLMCFKHKVWRSKGAASSAPALFTRTSASCAWPSLVVARRGWRR